MTEKTYRAASEAIKDFIHSFIHSFILETYIAHLQETTTQRRSQPMVTVKKEGLQTSGWAISKERSSKGRSFHADGPTTEKALRCIIAKRARLRRTRDQKLTPRSRTQHPTCGQNRHWAAEVAEVRGGAAKYT